MKARGLWCGGEGWESNGPGRFDIGGWVFSFKAKVMPSLFPFSTFSFSFQEGVYIYISLSI